MENFLVQIIVMNMHEVNATPPPLCSRAHIASLWPLSVIIDTDRQYLS